MGIEQKRNCKDGLPKVEHSQNEIESELSDAVPHGIRRQIARDTGIYESVIYGYFNPDDERKSPHFTVLQIQAALDNSDDPVAVQAGENLWQKMCILRQMSMPRRESDLCIDEEISKHAQEATDVVVARLGNKSLYRQLIEVNEAAKAIESTRQAILEAIHKEKSTPNAGRTRLNGSGAVQQIRRAK